jgi:hypothetical protein
MKEYINKTINDMLKGRKIVLERSGLDVSKIDSMTSDDEVRHYIKNNRNSVEKNEKYLLAIARKRFMPITDKGGMTFKAFYDTSPMTTGDSAEVAFQLMEIGRGHQVRREVSNKFQGEEYCDLFGSKEKITISERKSDIVVTHKDGYTTHVESKVGLTIGKKKQNDLKQEVLADIYRVQHDQKTRQVTVICRNSNNGLSELDDREYMNLQYIAKKALGDRWDVIYEGRKLTVQELKAFAERPKKMPVSECFQLNPLQIKGETCSAEKMSVDNYIDQKVKSVNGFQGLQNTTQTSIECNSRSKVSDYASTYIKEPSISAKFLSDIKTGAIQGAKQSAIRNGVQALFEIMSDSTSKEEAIAEAITSTAKSAIKTGLISATTNLAQNLASKTSSQIYSKILKGSAKAFASFCNGGMTFEGMLQESVKGIASKGLTYAQSKIFGSTVSSLATAGASATSSAAGTVAAGCSAAGVLKFVAGAFLSCVILGLLFDSGDSLPVYNDPRVSTFVQIDETGHCKITSSTDDNLVAKLINYNKKLDELKEKTWLVRKETKKFKIKAQAALDNELNELHKGLGYMQEEILRISKRKAIENESKY